MPWKGTEYVRIMAQYPLNSCIIHYNIGDLLLLEVVLIRACINSWSLIANSSPSHILYYIKAATVQYNFGKLFWMYTYMLIYKYL